MATYVLVHGGWSGAHGFRHVRRRLAAAGHEVFTPSLTGIVLLGFSYGGFVVTAALAHVARRISHLVYLDAFVPDDGETALGHTLGIEAGPAALGEDWSVAPNHELATTHIVPSNRPDALTEILLASEV